VCNTGRGPDQNGGFEGAPSESMEIARCDGAARPPYSRRSVMIFGEKLHTESRMGDNQTKEEEVQSITAGTKGSGIFAVPNPESREADGIRKVIVTDIDYPMSVQLGRNCVAFKLVPRILPKDDVKCANDGHLCVKTCANDLCLCVNGTCQ
jgi:hypothetical protein